MLKNAAENVFMEVLSEVSSIQKNGITHSDEYFEIMLEDANLPNEEKTEVLISARQAAKAKIKELEEQRRGVAEGVSIYEDKKLLENAIAKEQRDSFLCQVIWLSAVFFMLVALILLVFCVRSHLNGLYTVSIVLVGYIFSLGLAVAVSNKATLYAHAEEKFLENLSNRKRELARVEADILSLERLKTLADNDLALNKPGSEMTDDLK
ncbi:hypothetical protein IKG48_01015 [Candidatus Saccharibacteria bacterium]|nr:hypothetical protein [Candidatus Saccharibacteria bacterium]